MEATADEQLAQPLLQPRQCSSSTEPNSASSSLFRIAGPAIVVYFLNSVSSLSTQIFRGHLCGILPKKCHVASSPLDTQTSPLRHVELLIPPGRRFSLIPPGREFCPADVPPSPDISHPEFCPDDVPPSLDISQPAPVAEWERRAIQLPRSDMSGSSGSTYPENIRSRQFRFPG
ncbi:hypothetical protein CK203_014738 [Vitis vinifera]|uniref:Uncharacterized protein n=1 Tax=Vitis vinifera TaxID=29760 RepID=A0A438JG78_VITVI|nr:hypothetical protein CK203_014738 [Vitis vinifera]